jgi:hypothetical protein
MPLKKRSMEKMAKIVDGQIEAFLIESLAITHLGAPHPYPIKKVD